MVLGGFLEEGDEDGELLGGVLRAADGGEEVLHRAGGDAAELAALAEDGVGLAGAGLAVGEDAGVVAFEDVVDLRGRVSCGHKLSPVRGILAAGQAPEADNNDRTLPADSMPGEYPANGGGRRNKAGPLAMNLVLLRHQTEIRVRWDHCPRMTCSCGENFRNRLVVKIISSNSYLIFMRPGCSGNIFTVSAASMDGSAGGRNLTTTLTFAFSADIFNGWFDQSLTRSETPLAHHFCTAIWSTY